MENAWLNSSCYYAPTPRPGIFSRGSIPYPGYRQGDNSQPRGQTKNKLMKRRWKHLFLYLNKNLSFRTIEVLSEAEQIMFIETRTIKFQYYNQGAGPTTLPLAVENWNELLTTLIVLKTMQNGVFLSLSENKLLVYKKIKMFALSIF